MKKSYFKKNKKLTNPKHVSIIKEKVNNLSMQKIKDYLITLRGRLRGADNYLTSITILTGSVAFIFVTSVVILALMPASTKKDLNNKFAGVKNTITQKPTPIPTPTPRPIAKGPQTYTVSSGQNPLISEVWVNEFDPKKGQEQIYKVKIKDKKGASITSIELNLTTDHEAKTYPFKLISGTETEGEWQVSVVTNDSHDYVYLPYITAKNNIKDISKLELSFR
ncbi:hypothetical protein M1349_03500 [Patescibacteria group bacterium]|nr:hypothetical protein [Patescibacteria group bacterium]